MTTLELLKITDEQKEKGIFIQGNEENGEYKEWWYNGQLFKHCFFKNERLEGEYKRWYSNGQLFIHCFYKNGELEENCGIRPILNNEEENKKGWLFTSYNSFVRHIKDRYRGNDLLFLCDCPDGSMQLRCSVCNRSFNSKNYREDELCPYCKSLLVYRPWCEW